MSEPKQNRNVFDNEYDNDTWTEKEISLSSKVLVALGGITSLGGMIPLIIKNLSQSLFDFNVGPGFFVIFTIVYFGLPLVILIAWSQFTNRIVSPTGKDNNGENNGETKWRHFKRFPVTYRYKKLIWIHVLLIAIYLIFAIYLPNAYLLLWLSPLLFISTAIAIWTFTKRSYSNKKINVSWVKLFASGIILVFLITIWIIYARDIKKTLDLQGVETDLENEDYEKIAYVEETSARLNHIEDDLVNEVDRFYILSGMNAWNILSQQMTVFEDSVDLSAFKIESSIATLNSFIIDDDARLLAPKKDQYILEMLAKNDSLKKIVWQKRQLERRNNVKGNTNNANKVKTESTPKFFMPHNPFCKKHYKKVRNPDIDTNTNHFFLGRNVNQIFIAPSNDSAVLKKVLEPRINQMSNSLISAKKLEKEIKDTTLKHLNSINSIKDSSRIESLKHDIDILEYDIKKLEAIKEKEKPTFREILPLSYTIGDKIDFKMGMVNEHIDEMLDNENHRLFPDCFSHFIIFPPIDTTGTDTTCKNFYSVNWNKESFNEKEVRIYKDTLVNVVPNTCFCNQFDKNLNQKHSSFHNYDLIKVDDYVTLYAIRLTQEVKEKLAATMNRRNSKVLKDWIEGMYLPYAQRKTGKEIQTIGEETEWIWKEIKYMGIIISFATLLLLTLQYLELYDLKNYIINSQILKSDKDISPEDKENAKSRISDLNNKANYLLFPLTTTLTIVAV